jgi:hypothetical protein
MNRSGLETISRDLLYALRTLRRNPIFAIVAILTLALAMGANTTIFSVVHAVLLKPLAYRNPDRLVQISGGATPTRFEEIKTGTRSYTSVGAFTGQENLTLTGGAHPEVLKGARVSASFLSILNASPLLGRSFLPQEDSPGGPAVALISAELWQRRFGGDPQTVGKTVDLGGTSYTIVGVLPARFQFPFAGLDIWLTQPANGPTASPKSRARSARP